MARIITEKYLRYESGDELICNCNVKNLRYTDREIEEGATVIVRGWERAVAGLPDVVFLEGYEGAYHAGYFRLHPHSTPNVVDEYEDEIERLQTNHAAETEHLHSEIATLRVEVDCLRQVNDNLRDAGWAVKS